MVKKKRISPAYIISGILAILLVLTIVMGVTGAWFTSSASSNGETINMRFGAVDYDLTIGTTVKDGNVDAQITENAIAYDLIGVLYQSGGKVVYDQDHYRWLERNDSVLNSGTWIKTYEPGIEQPTDINNDPRLTIYWVSRGGFEYRENGALNFYDADGTLNNDSGLYVKKAREVTATEVVAGTVVQSQIAIENSSTVDSFYVLVGADGKNYVVNATSHALVEVTSSNAATVYAQAKTGKGALAKGTGISFGTRFTLKNWVGDGSQGAIWTAEYTNDGSTWTALSTPVATASSAIHSGDEIDLGVYLFNEAFELRAIQASNLPAYGADVLTMLTTNWAATSAITGA